VVQNAIDDTELREAMRSILPAEIESLRRELGVEGRNVAVYCGGLYAEKRLDFLLMACQRVRNLISDFEVVFIGSGPEQHVVAAAAERHGWISYIGPVFGADRARYFAMSQALLMPGPVGLAVVDSFVAGVPLFTTDISGHGPEIAYLAHGVNGVISQFDVEEYARTMAECLNSPNKMKRLRQGCLESATVYTLDNMVLNFGDGIVACLAAERR
jgi:glycosyltransferase involved in cell wall biosynthesis